MLDAVLCMEAFSPGTVAAVHGHSGDIDIALCPSPLAGARRPEGSA